MANAPIVDPLSIDTSRLLATREELYRLLKQQGKFAFLDGVVQHDIEAGIIVGIMDVTGDAWWAEDHVPGRPLLPGTLMIEAGAQLCTFDFIPRRPDLDGAFVGFAGVDKARFRRAVEPDCRLLIVGKTLKLRSRMYTYLIQGFVDGEMAFDAEVKGVVLATGE